MTEFLVAFSVIVLIVWRVAHMVRLGIRGRSGPFVV